jgi:uncharacterized protein (DUF2235 family)
VTEHGTLQSSSITARRAHPVVRIAFRIAKCDEHIPQIIFYDQGVGTGNFLDRVSGVALGEGLEEIFTMPIVFSSPILNLMMRFYLFGFSRRAFTASIASSTSFLLGTFGMSAPPYLMRTSVEFRARID